MATHACNVRPYRMRLSYYLLVASCVVLAPFTVGCGADERVREAIGKIDKLIAAVDGTTNNITKESSRWRDDLKMLEGKLQEHGADLLARDLRQFTDLTIGSAGTELLFIVDVMEEKIKSNLSQLKAALTDAKSELLKGNVSGSVDDVLADLTVTLPPPEPRVCRFTLSHLVVLYTNEYDVPPTFGVGNPSSLIIVDGYGFLRPKEEKKSYTLAIIDKDGRPRSIANPDALILSTTSSYQMQLNLQKLAGEIEEGDAKLIVRWGDEQISNSEMAPNDPSIRHELPIVFDEKSKPKKPVDAPRSMIVSVRVEFETTGDDKDRPIEFTLTPHLPQESVLALSGKSSPGARANISVGLGEEWPKGDKSRGFVVPLDIPIPVDERLHYMLRITYNNREGNHGWEGRITSIQGVTRDYSQPQIPLRGDTGDFKLGENGNPKMRDFPFDQ